MSREWPLVGFTTLMPASIGMTLVGTISGQLSKAGIPTVIVGGIGMLASLGHLARPVRSPLSVSNWRQSWVSREIIASCAYWFSAVIWGLAVGEPIIARLVAACSAVLGLILVYVMARAYQIHSRPAWDGTETLLELYAVVFTVGVPVGMLVLLLGAGDMIVWGGIVAVGIGAALDLWTIVNRPRRLAQLPQQRNVVGTLARYRQLFPRNRVVLVLDGIALVFSIASAVSPQAARWFWSVVLLAGLVGHIIARAVFYAMPIQTCHAPRLRPPWTRPSVG